MAGPIWRAVTIVLVCIIGTSLLNVIPPLLYRDLIDNVLPYGKVGRLNLLALGMFGIPILSGAISVVQRYFSASAGEGIIFDLRQQMYTHLQRMSLRFFTHTKSGEIISRFNNDVVGAQDAIMGTIPDLVTNVVTLVSTLVVMMSIEWRLALLSVAVFPLFLLPSRRVAHTLRDIRRRAMEYNADMSNIVNETLTINGALLVKTFGSQRREVQRFGKTNADVRDIGVRRAQVGQIFFMGLSIAGTIGTALIYWVGGHMVLSHVITVGTIVAFVAYLFRLYGPISALSTVHTGFAQSMVSFERVFEYLDKPVEIVDNPNAHPFMNVAGHIKFEHVWFQYAGPDAPPIENAATQIADSPSVPSPGSHANGKATNDHDNPYTPIPTRRWALENVSFEIRPGQLAALVGPAAPGRLPSPIYCPASMIPQKGALHWMGKICATALWSPWPAKLAWLPKNHTCSTTPFAPTCFTRDRARRKPSWILPAAPPISTN